MIATVPIQVIASSNIACQAARSVPSPDSQWYGLQGSLPTANGQSARFIGFDAATAAESEVRLAGVVGDAGAVMQRCRIHRVGGCGPEYGAVLRGRGVTLGLAS